MISYQPESTRKRLLAIVAIAMLEGCGEKHELTTSTVPMASAVQRILVRSAGPGPDSLDPHKAESIEAQRILRDVFECLTTLDHDANPAPGAAISWTVSSDGKTYTFALRPNGRWSNGDRVTGADFVAGLRRLVDPTTASSYGQFIDVIRNARPILLHKLRVEELGVTAPDEFTVSILLEHSAPYFPALLSHPSTCPLHRPTFNALGGKFARPGVMVSNGAFTLAEWISGQHVLLRRNPYYWDQGSNRLDGVKWLIISDENAEYLRYRSGEIDITSSVPRAQLVNIKNTMPEQLYLGRGIGTDYYGFNLSRPPFRDNLPLRRALMLAIDRDQLIRSILQFGEQAAYGWVPAGTQNYETQSLLTASGPIANRVKEARRLFSESGYSPAHPLHFELRYNSSDIHRLIAVSIASMWHDILGVDVSLLGVDFPTLLADVESQRVDMFRSSWIGDYNDAQSFLQVFASDSGTNLPHYRSLEYDALLARAASEPNSDDRRALLQGAERVLLRDAPIVPIYFHVSAHLIKPTVHGWYQNIMNVTYSKDLSLAE